MAVHVQRSLRIVYLFRIAIVVSELLWQTALDEAANVDSKLSAFIHTHQLHCNNSSSSSRSSSSNVRRDPAATYSKQATSQPTGRGRPLQCIIFIRPPY
jgi:hypothetical protein